MNHRMLGRTGLKVGEICLGTMTFGWLADEVLSRRVLNRYAEAGGNFIDTADIYAEGQSEKIIGRWLKGRVRDQFIIATKVRFATGKGPDDAGLGRKHILSAVESSLRRLQTDYIDLYQAHCWDGRTPLEETLGTLDELVKGGKVRHFGISNFMGWQLQKAVDLCRYRGWDAPVTLQALYNLLDRFLEWDLLPVCANEGLGLLCWSPLAAGWLTGKFRRGMTGPPTGSRVHLAEGKGWSESWSNYNMEHTWKVLDEFLAVAAQTGRSPSQVAINWLLHRPGVTSAVVGVETTEQLEENLGATGWSLNEKQMGRLNAASEQMPPRYPYGFINRFN